MINSVIALSSAKRVVVVGPPGAGKSTFSLKLAELLVLPLVHLDQLHWQPGWRAIDDVRFRRRIREVVDTEQWIMDGSYTATLPMRLARADVVINLDYPRRVFMRRLIRRYQEHVGGRRRADMAPGCVERLSFSFLKYAWRFPTGQRPAVLRAIALSEATELRLHHVEQTEALLVGVAGHTCTARKQVPGPN